MHLRCGRGRSKLGFEWNGASEKNRKYSSQGICEQGYFNTGFIHDIVVSISTNREKLLSALQDLRVKEEATGQALDAEKKSIKEKLKQMT